MKIANFNAIAHSILGIIFIVLGMFKEVDTMTIIGFIFLGESIMWQIMGRMDDIIDRLNKIENKIDENNE